MVTVAMALCISLPWVMAIMMWPWLVAVLSLSNLDVICSYCEVWFIRHWLESWDLLYILIATVASVSHHWPPSVTPRINNSTKVVSVTCSYQTKVYTQDHPECCGYGPWLLLDCCDVAFIERIMYQWALWLPDCYHFHNLLREINVNLPAPKAWYEPW